MALWQTKSGVSCEIDGLDHQESWRLDANSTTMNIVIAWSKRQTFLSDMLGYSKRNPGNTKITRGLPEVCPGVTWGLPQYCTNCELVAVTGLNDYTPSTGNVSNATNATPIVITTSAAHGLTDSVFAASDNVWSQSQVSASLGRGIITIASVGGNTAANGTWAFKVLSDTTLQLIGSAGNGAYTSGGTWSSTSLATTNLPHSYAKAKYRCTFQTLPYILKSDLDISTETDERKRYVYRRRRFISREQKIPGGGFKFSGTSTPLAEVGFRVSEEIEYQYTWYSVPVAALPIDYVRDYAGHVNQASWTDNNGTSSNNFAAQTMLFKGMDEKNYYDASGTLVADVTYLFSFRGGTWNYFPDRNGVFRQVVDVTNGLTLYPDVIDGPAPAAGTRGIISINSAGNVDFTNLFKTV